jgi:hypothetical protein
MQNKNTNTGSKLSMDLQDSPGDKKEMQEPEITVIDLPEVTDIPWQENIPMLPLVCLQSKAALSLVCN